MVKFDSMCAPVYFCVLGCEVIPQLTELTQHPIPSQALL